MTTLIIKVDDDRTESLKKILNEIPYVRGVEVEVDDVLLSEPSTQYQNIKKILDKAKDKNLFQDIKDPVEWQREIRKEWDRDF
jgi:UDP-N-acetylmuramyl tripeptide synthase